MKRLVLGKGHVQPVWAGHPWVFQQATERTEGRPAHGDEVEVWDAAGHQLGMATYSEGSAICARIYSRTPGERFGRELFERRLRSALALRLELGVGVPDGHERTTGYRVLHGEGDELPGLVVDRFGDVVVYQLGTAALAARRAEVQDAIEAVLAPRAIIERTSQRTAQQERFEGISGVVRGKEPEALVFEERGLAFELPLALTQKTGFYFDQRPLRARVEALSRGRRVLDAYSFVGAIALSAQRGGASSVLAVDSSEPAIQVARALSAKNALAIEARAADAEVVLGEQESAYDLVVVDPPKFAHKRADVPRASARFRRIAASALRAAAPGGLVVVSSCSSAIGMGELGRIVALGARDAGKEARVVERVFQGADHPVPPAFPEGLYLSTLILRVE